ncbi:MAG: FecR domain-containing protein [Planctomycetes bacterium]|nr:FecR domain-containing protein [Planctomycetota bacterium]
MNCFEVVEKIELFASGELDKVTSEAMQVHIQLCVKCTQSFDEASKLIDLLNIKFNTESVPSALIERFKSGAEAHEEPIAVADVRSSRKFWVFPAVFATAIVLFAIVLWKVLTSPVSESSMHLSKTLFSDRVALWYSSDTNLQNIDGNTVTLNRGKVFVDVFHSSTEKLSESVIEVETNYGVASAKGTKFFVESNEENKAVSIVVLDGVVEFKGASGTVTLAKGGYLHLNNSEDIAKNNASDLVDLNGKCAGQDGIPLQNVTVIATQGAHIVRATTDAKGVFSLNKVFKTQPVEIRLHRTGFSPVIARKLVTEEIMITLMKE